MIGVIYSLYNQFPGIIAIENLKASKVESDRKKTEGNVERPLEWALFRKFQQQGLVPLVSELIKLREYEKFPTPYRKQVKYEPLKQFGIISFISEEDTSRRCPSCGIKAYPADKEDEYMNDKEKKIFKCNECGFHNLQNPGEFKSLDSNDKVAAFNIAVKGFEGFF